MNYNTNFARVSLDALEYNYKRIKKMVPQSDIICMVKDDAYGHGAIECGKRLMECGVKCFGVAGAEEAAKIRVGLGDIPEIIIFGYVAPGDVHLLYEYKLEVNVFSLDYAKELATQIPEGKRIPIHIKIETGMNRLGFLPNIEGAMEVEKTARLGCFDLLGVFTHFSCSEQTDKPITRDQFNLYLTAINLLRNRGITFKRHHCCNSAAILNYPDMHLDTVRCGKALYGLFPGHRDDFRNILTFITHIEHIHKVNKGEVVGYGAKYQADRDIICATLPIGYGEGFVRAFAGGLPLMIKGKPAPIIGNICMNMCMVDITDIDAEIGDEVVVFGVGNNTVDYAMAVDMMPSECTDLIRNYIPRRYSDK